MAYSLRQARLSVGERFVAVDYTGTFLYAANKSSHDVSAYTLSSGVLKPIAASPFSSGMGPVSIALVRPRTIPLYAATEIPDPSYPHLSRASPRRRSITWEKLLAGVHLFRARVFWIRPSYAGGTSMVSLSAVRAQVTALTITVKSLAKPN